MYAIKCIKKQGENKYEYYLKINNNGTYWLYESENEITKIKDLKIALCFITLFTQLLKYKEETNIEFKIVEEKWSVLCTLSKE